MTLADYLTELSQTYQPWELLLKSNENSFTVTDFEKTCGLKSGSVLSGSKREVREISYVMRSLVSGCYRLFGPLLGGA